MKKSILVMAVAATMAASTAAVAEPKVYGNVHLSINAADNDIPNADNNITMSSNTSSLGVKGSEDLGDGMKAIYKVEFGVNILGKPTTNPDSGFGATSGDADTTQGDGVLNGRDQFVGLKGGFGTLKLGTMSSNYKQMGGKVDPFYRTPLEGRGFLKTQSSELHGGRGITRGRQTNTLQYVSPKMGGISLVANTTLSGSNDETSGIGVRWSNKAILVYVDYITGQASNNAQLDCTTANGCTTEAAVKAGAKFGTKVFSVSGQYEAAEDRTGADFIFLAGTFNINKNNMIGLTYGTRTEKVVGTQIANDSTGVALLYNHKLSKMTNVYAGYGARDEDATNGDVSMLTFGIRKKF